jgi:hypothetical protein
MKSTKFTGREARDQLVARVADRIFFKVDAVTRPDEPVGVSRI